MLSYLKQLLFGKEEINKQLVNDVLTKLNKDVARQIIMELEDEDVLKICEFDEAVSRNLCDNAFFYNRLKKNYPNLVKPENLSWKKYYLLVIQYIALLKEEYNFEFSKTSKADPQVYYNILSNYNSEAGLERAALLGLKDLLSFYLDTEEEIYTGNVFSNAVQSNDKATIYYLLDLPNIEKDWNTALYKAAANKNKTLINLFLEKGANVNEGLEGAAKAGDMSLINFFIEKGADDWSSSITASALSENKEITAFFIDKAEKAGVPINWKQALNSAAISGNLPLVKFFYQQTEFTQSDLGNAVSQAIRSKNSKEIVKYLISKGFNNWDLGYHYSKVYGNKEMMEFFKQKKNE